MKYGELPLVTLPSGESANAVMIRVPNPPKSAYLRLPNNEELLEYFGKQKHLYRDLGRNKGITEEIPNPASDMALFKSIRLDRDGEEFDEYEASMALGKVLRCKAMSCEREGDGYRVIVDTAFGEVSHLVSIPFQRDLAVYRRGVYRAIELPYGQEERRFPPEVPAALYKAIIQGIEGYADGITVDTVPLNHRRVVAVSVVQALQDLDAPVDPNS